MKKTVFFEFLAIMLVIGFNGCRNGTTNVNTEFTVTFDLEGGNISGDTNTLQINVISGGTISNLPNPEKNENDFIGFFTQKNGEGSSFTSSTIVENDLTVYASWKQFTIPSQLHGTWYITPLTDYMVISKYSIFVDRAYGTFTADINSFIVVNNDNDLKKDEFPSGYKLTGSFVSGTDGYENSIGNDLIVSFYLNSQNDKIYFNGITYVR